jgi:hypothetical protein
MAITLDGTNGITTPDVDTDGLTVDTNTLFVDAANNRVGVGTSSPARILHVVSSTSDSFRITNPQPRIEFDESDTTDQNWAIRANSGRLTFETRSDDFITVTERARIDESGNLLVGQTARGGVAADSFDLDVTDGIFYQNHSSIRGSGALFTQFRFNGTAIGSISQSGTTGVAFNTSSDYRLKEDVQPMVGATDRLMALKPVNFAWKIDGSRVDGFLAHEAQEVVPECVTGEKDAVDDEGNPEYQGIDQSKIVPLLVAALQEALTKIEALEARVAALETNA